jgi:hypothetical protein
MAKAAARELRTQIQISSFDQKSILRLVTLCSVCNEYFFQLDAELPIGDLKLANQRFPYRNHPFFRNSVAYSAANH